jgi:hypothetical protein
MCWPIIKVHFMAAIHYITTQDGCSFHWLNQAYITLLPKKGDVDICRLQTYQFSSWCGKNILKGYGLQIGSQDELPSFT